MDLTTLWQEHKAFILSVVAGLLVFFVGQTIISSTYGIDEKRLQRTKYKSALRKRNTPTTGQLNEARRLNEELRARFDAAVDRVNFVPEKKYLLSRKEKPDIQYDRVFGEARDLYVEEAKTLNISVDENLGMPELSPTRQSEIQRALSALDIVSRVVLLAMESGVRFVDSIEMVPESGRQKKSFIKEQQVKFKMLGSTVAMADFIKRFTRLENFLALDEAEFKTADKDGASIRGTFRVSALTIIKEDSES